MKTYRGQRWYRPSEIARLGLIQNSKGEAGSTRSHYYYVIRLINAGKIKAKNYGHGKTPYYLISETEIQRYHEQEALVRR